MSTPVNHEGNELLVQFRQVLADCRALFEACAARDAQSPKNADLASDSDREDRLNELQRGLVVKVFVEIAQSDWKWCDSEYALAGILFEQLWGRRLEGEQLRAALKKTVQQAGNLRWGSLVRPFATNPALREFVGQLNTVVMRLANLIAKVDGQVTPEEAQRLKGIQHELDVNLTPIPLADAAPLTPGTGSSAPDRAVDRAMSRAAGHKKEVGHVRQRDMASDESTRRRQFDEALRELDGLIGLASIKDDIKELVNFLKVQTERERQGLPRTQVALHMVFEGNPGTGKTTVARLLGRILGGMGILSRGHLVETDRSGLVARYAGQTAPKAHKQIDEALDGVLFIDEAYSLVAEDGEDAYGHEALQVLLKRVEDDRHRLVVVLAGYPGPMEELLASNPGLNSRFSRRLVFPDYSASELGRIFQCLCETNHYRLPATTRLKLLLGFRYLLDHRDDSFGNGRLARNVFESAIRRLANRVADVAPLTAELLTTLDPLDVKFPNVPEAALDLAEDRRHRLSIDCPGCRQPATFRPARLGHRVQCRRCRTTFQLDWGEFVASN